MNSRLLIIVLIATLVVAGPPSLRKYQQISAGEALRAEIVTGLTDDRTSLTNLRDQRVKGIADYGYFSGPSLDANGLRTYLELGGADAGPKFWAVLSIHDQRPQLEIPVEERSTLREKRLFLWRVGLCGNSTCNYDKSKLVEIPIELWKEYELKVLETSYIAEKSGFTYTISLDILVDRRIIGTQDSVLMSICAARTLLFFPSPEGT
jgi:hypothetical protein